MLKSPMCTYWDWPFTQVGNWQRSINEFPLLLFAVVARPLNSSSHKSECYRHTPFLLHQLTTSPPTALIAEN